MKKLLLSVFKRRWNFFDVVFIAVVTDLFRAEAWLGAVIVLVLCSWFSGFMDAWLKDKS